MSDSTASNQPSSVTSSPSQRADQQHGAAESRRYRRLDCSEAQHASPPRSSEPTHAPGGSTPTRPVRES